MSAAKPETMYLVDAHSLIFQVFHAIAPMSSPAGLPTNAVFGFTRDVFFLRDKHPTYLIVVFDAPGRTFRDDIFKEYKAHRSPMPDDLQLQIPLIHEMLEGFRLPVLAQQGVEADDLIATLARRGEERGMDVFICSSDKDCRQLLSERVRIFNLRKKELFDREALLRDWCIKPEQVIDYQTLVGDSVDNVPGVPGVGPKTAAQYLQQYGTIENLLKNLDQLPAKKRETLEQARQKIPISRELVTLKTDLKVDIDWEGWKLAAWDGPRLLELFRTWGFGRFQDLVRTSLPATSLREPEAPAPPPPPLTTIPRAPRATPPVQGDLFGGLVSEETAAVATAPEPTTIGWKHDYRLVNSDRDFEVFVRQLNKQKRFAIDLETNSLEPHAAKIVGIAICWEAGLAWYLAMCGPQGEQTLPAEMLEKLRPILENPKIAKVNQNIKYDWQVLKAHGIEMAGVAGDSMVADYLLRAGERSHGLDVLSEKYLNHRPIPIVELIGKGKAMLSMDQVPCMKVAEYACEDADIAWRLAETLEPLLEREGFKRPAGKRGGTYLYDDIEIALIEVLTDMEFAGIRLDVPALQRMSKDMGQELEKLEADVYRLAGREFNISSVKQLREILFGELKFKPTHKTALTGAASTDQSALEELARQGHELPQKLLEHRKIAKLKSTYVDALPALVQVKTGRVHASFNQTVAATGRLSSSDPNLQNIPIRSEQGGQIRQAFLPREGWSLVVADYSQIELRLLAHFCKDPTLRRAFAEEQDIHTLVASQIFHVPPGEVTANHRRVAKTVNFGVIYGISAFGLADRLEISKEEAQAFIDTFFKEHPRVLEYQDRLLHDCRAKGYVSTILGRRRAISGIRASTSYKNRVQPEREAINIEIQGSAADLIKVAMLNIHRRLKTENRQAKLLLQIHDELVLEAPPKEVEPVSTLVREEMAGALSDQIDVPIAVDLGVGPNWLDLQ